jgi:hypothetical protein
MNAVAELHGCRSVLGITTFCLDSPFNISTSSALFNTRLVNLIEDKKEPSHNSYFWSKHRRLGKPRRWWEDGIRMDLGENGRGGGGGGGVDSPGSG